MLERVGDEQRQHAKGAQVEKAGQCDRHYVCPEVVEVLPAERHAREVAKSCSDECAGHLDEAAAEQKHEGEARKARRQAQLPGAVAGLTMFNLVEHLVDVVYGERVEVGLELVLEALHDLDALGVDAGLGQRHDLGERRAAVRHGGVDGDEADVGRA